MTIKITSSDQVQQIGKLRTERYTYRAIAERFGVGISTIRDICKKNGFEPQMIADIPLPTGGDLGHAAG